MITMASFYKKSSRCSRNSSEQKNKDRKTIDKEKRTGKNKKTENLTEKEKRK